MSTGKRLAKRSILGTRVAAPGPDGIYRAGVIQAVKTRGQEDPGSMFMADDSSSSLSSCRYSVRFEEGARRGATFEFSGADLVGPGFGGVGARLVRGQRVFVTHNGREMAATVSHHDADANEVIINLGGEDKVRFLLSFYSRS